MYSNFRALCFLVCIIPLMIACNGNGGGTDMGRDGFWKGTFTGNDVNSNLLAILIPTVKADEAGYFEQQKLTSHLLINLFLKKLDQEKLLIFGHAVNRSDLHSHQVSYVHNVVDDSLQARLFFKLKKITLIPGFEEYYVDGIVVEMDKDGKIMEVSTQVSRLTKEDSD